MTACYWKTVCAGPQLEHSHRLDQLSDQRLGLTRGVFQRWGDDSWLFDMPRIVNEPIIFTTFTYLHHLQFTFAEKPTSQPPQPTPLFPSCSPAAAHKGTNSGSRSKVLGTATNCGAARGVVPAAWWPMFVPTTWSAGAASCYASCRSKLLCKKHWVTAQPCDALKNHPHPSLGVPQQQHLQHLHSLLRQCSKYIKPTVSDQGVGSHPKGLAGDLQPVGSHCGPRSFDASLSPETGSSERNQVPRWHPDCPGHPKQKNTRSTRGVLPPGRRMRLTPNGGPKPVVNPTNFYRDVLTKMTKDGLTYPRRSMYKDI